MEWINIQEKKPERNKYVLVETKYCRYPATVAFWSGLYFRDVNDGKIMNAKNWCEISQVPKYKEPEKNNYILLKKAISEIEESFITAREIKVADDEDLVMIFDSIGSMVSSLYHFLKKISPEAEKRLEDYKNKSSLHPGCDAACFYGCTKGGQQEPECINEQVKR
jgi:hypothetical protein